MEYFIPLYFIRNSPVFYSFITLSTLHFTGLKRRVEGRGERKPEKALAVAPTSVN